MHFYKSIFCICALFCMFSKASCEEAKQSNPQLLYVGLGIYDIIHDPHNPLAQLEWRTHFSFYEKLRPLIGILSTDKLTTYLYGGLALDLFLGKRVVLTPSLAGGYYCPGHGKNLGFPLEFRSSMELAYVTKSQSRFGAMFYHISNASLGHRNPGGEALVFFYAIPLD